MEALICTFDLCLVTNLYAATKAPAVERKQKTGLRRKKVLREIFFFAAVDIFLSFREAIFTHCDKPKFLTEFHINCLTKLYATGKKMFKLLLGQKANDRGRSASVTAIESASFY